MTYQVLARKWRPHTFHQVVGQQHVLKALINSLEQGRLHHAYLFSGTRGVGKTTIARILAKCLNCEIGVTSTPCGKCDSCRAIDQGNFVDLLEIDAASRTKVEDTRELLDNVQYRPAQGRYKVYLIDEVHMLSRSSFNALLKTLEEPPPYVKFLLATTDPQKLPITILSRCLQFHLKALDREQIVGQLERVLDAEAQPYEVPALALLAKAADGSMRDALSLTDQALAHGNGHVHLDQVQAMLGTLDHRHLYQMLHCLQHLDGPGLMQKVAEVSQLGPDFSLLHAELTALLHRLAMTQLLGSSLDSLATDNEQLLTYARVFSAEELQLYYQIAIAGRKELPFAPDGRSGLEMTLLRMLAFSPRKAFDNTSQLISTTSNRVAQSAVVPISPSNPAPASLAVKPLMGEPMTVSDEVGEPEDEEVAQLSGLLAEQQQIEKDAVELMAVEPVVVESGLAQLLQARNRLRSQTRELPSTEPVMDTSLPDRVPARGASFDVEPRRFPSSAMVATVSDASSLAAQQVSAPFFASELPSSQGDLPPWETPPVEAYTSDASQPDGQPSHDTGPRIESVTATPARQQQIPPNVPVQAIDDAAATSLQVASPDANARWHSNDLLSGCGEPWAELIASSQMKGRLRQLALHSTREVISESQWRLTVVPEFRHMISPKAITLLEEAISAAVGHAVAISLGDGEISSVTPWQIEQQRFADLLQQAREDLASEPDVQFLIERFGAQLNAASIQPLKH